METVPRLIRGGGNWVDKERFWDRKEDLELLLGELREGSHILLIAQRRMGKTSLMREASHRVGDEFLCLHVDLEKAESPADALVELSVATRPYSSLWEKTKSIYSNTLGKLLDQVESLQVSDVSVKLRSGLTENDWQAKGNQLLEQLAGSEKPVIIFFDEVPILVNRMLKGNDYKITEERRRQTDAFMSWLRDNSIRHRGKIRMVITGSIGLEPILRQGNLSATVNTFSPFSLGPWSPEVAIGCIEALGSQYGVVFQEGAIPEMVNRLGACVPHHVQLFFKFVHEHWVRSGSKPISKSTVIGIYESDMLSTRGHAELSHLEERLKLIFGPTLYPIALEILTEAAVTGSITFDLVRLLCPDQDGNTNTRESGEIAREIMSVLEHDGYLRVQAAENYTFNSALLRDWWKARFVSTYIPIAKRSIAK